MVIWVKILLVSSSINFKLANTFHNVLIGCYLNNYEFIKSSKHGKMTGVRDESNCQRMCYESAKCNFWEYDKTPKICYFYHEVKKVNPKKGWSIGPKKCMQKEDEDKEKSNILEVIMILLFDHSFQMLKFISDEKPCFEDGTSYPHKKDSRITTIKNIPDANGDKICQQHCMKSYLKDSNPTIHGILNYAYYEWDKDCKYFEYEKSTKTCALYWRRGERKSVSSVKSGLAFCPVGLGNFHKNIV